MNSENKLNEAQKKYLINFFQVFGLLLVIWAVLPHVLANQPDELGQRVTGMEYLLMYCFLSGCCVLYTCHSIAREFYRDERFEEYFKLKGLSRDEYLKSRELLDYIK